LGQKDWEFPSSLCYKILSWPAKSCLKERKKERELEREGRMETFEELKKRY
jgi:hypothetical protein